MQAEKMATTRMEYGAPGTIRTCDPLVRSWKQAATISAPYLSVFYGNTLLAPFNNQLVTSQFYGDFAL